MSLRPQRDEANIADSLDTEVPNRGRALQSGEVHGLANIEREDAKTEHPGQTCPNSKEKRLDTGVKKGGRCEMAQKTTKNAQEEELIAEMYEMTLCA